MRVDERGRWVTSYELAMKGYSASKLVKMFGEDRIFISYTDDTAWIPEDIGRVIFGTGYISSSTFSYTMELVEEVNVKRRIVLEEKE